MMLESPNASAVTVTVMFVPLGHDDDDGISNV